MSTMPVGDAFPTVLAAAQENAPWAFERLYREFSPTVAGFLRLQGLADPDDVVSEAFMSAFSAIGRFGGSEGAFRAWLFTIARRRLVDEWRRGSRRPPTTEEAMGANAAGGDAEDDALGQIGSERVEALLAGLAPDQRDVLMLRIVADMTVEQVAEALGKTEGAVKALQRRGLDALRREISRKGVPL